MFISSHTHTHSMLFTCNMHCLTKSIDYKQGALLTYTMCYWVTKCVAELQSVLLSYKMYYPDLNACCSLARCIVYLQGVLLLTWHVVHQQGVLFTDTGCCLPARCVVTDMACCSPARFFFFFTDIGCCLPARHVVTDMACCLPARCACLWPDPPLVASALLSWLSAPWLSPLASHLRLPLTLRSPQSHLPSVSQW